MATAFRDRGDITVERVRKKGGVQSFQLAAEVLDLEQVDGATLRFTLALHNSGASVRPDELLREILGPGASGLRLVREELLVNWTGRLVDPLLAASASHVVRAAG